MNLKDYIGQKKTIETIKILIEACQRKNKNFPHSIISGESGCGKTTLARCIAGELKAKFTETNAACLKDPMSIYLEFTDWNDESNKEYKVIFIDEIHALDKKTQEAFYSIIEEGKIKTDNSSQNELMELNLGNFTVLGATTESVNIPLLHRFEHHFILSEYDKDELIQIIRLQNQNKFDPTLLYEYCRGNPRLAKHLSQWIIDYHSVKSGNIDDNLVEKAMNQKEIKKYGLTPDDMKYLNFLYKERRFVGLQNVVAGTGISKDIITKQIEPYLIRQGFIFRGARGRLINLKKIKEWNY